MMAHCRGWGQQAEKIGEHASTVTVQGEVTFHQVLPLGQCPECGRLIALVNGKVRQHNGYTLPLEGEGDHGTELEAVTHGTEEGDAAGARGEQAEREPGEGEGAETGPWLSLPDVRV